MNSTINYEFIDGDGWIRVWYCLILIFRNEITDVCDGFFVNLAERKDCIFIYVVSFYAFRWGPRNYGRYFPNRSLKTFKQSLLGVPISWLLFRDNKEVLGRVVLHIDVFHILAAFIYAHKYLTRNIVISSLWNYASMLHTWPRKAWPCLSANTAELIETVAIVFTEYTLQALQMGWKWKGMEVVEIIEIMGK